jgi:hypothetical protein
VATGGTAHARAHGRIIRDAPHVDAPHSIKGRAASVSPHSLPLHDVDNGGAGGADGGDGDRGG